MIKPKKRWTFSYGYWTRATVTVYAADFNQAWAKARTEMDRRYEKRGWEPPVAWSFTLLKQPRRKT